MRAFGLLLILLACLIFALAFLDVDGGATDVPAKLALLAAALMISGAVFASVGAVGRRLQHEVSLALSGSAPGEPVKANAAPQPAIRRPGFHRRAA